MNKEEKEIIERIQQDSTFRERELLRIIKKQQAEIEKLKTKLENQKIEYQPSVTITNSELLKGKWNNDKSTRVNRLFKRKN